MSVTVLDNSPPAGLAKLVSSGLIRRGLHGPGQVGRASDRVVQPGADQVLPLLAELRTVSPWPGLRRGATVAVDAGARPGSAVTGAAGSTSLCLALLVEAMHAGSWCAVVGMPDLGATTAAEFGIDLGRLALVPDPGTEWVTVVAALLDGLDIVVVRPPGQLTPKLTRRLAARARQRGSVLISYGSWEGAELTLCTTGQVWHGLGAGSGRLRSRELTVVGYGRGSATRPRQTQVWWPPATPATGSAPATGPAPAEPTPLVPVEPAPLVPVEPAPLVPVEPTPLVPVEPTPLVPVAGAMEAAS
ncbi:MAG: hypothetical protein ACRDT4_19590 [Micromonosporaceae bacterium]